MSEPFLIQTAKFTNVPSRKGVDRFLAFDYMGSAEFENGALGESLRMMRTDAENFKLQTFNIGGKMITAFWNRQSFMSSWMERVLNSLGLNEVRLQEPIKFSEYIMNPSPNNQLPDFWWDIDNDFAFWRRNDEFCENFTKLIFHPNG